MKTEDKLHEHHVPVGSSFCIVCAMHEDAIEIERLRSRITALEAMLRRYRNEVPLGHQPHMCAAVVDALLGGGE